MGTNMLRHLLLLYFLNSLTNSLHLELSATFAASSTVQVQGGPKSN